MSSEKHDEIQPGERGHKLRSAKPVIVCLDGRQFRINQGIPQDVADKLEELFDQFSEVKYEQVPSHLKAYQMGTGEAPADGSQDAPTSE
ncbi:hypothetical protein N7517_009282 [Penicillium concentricum]|uniref:Uncharacterized protein n=1 Tax=Penicillium concentricum TaxID=293559 RepID=A0A9W9RH99_9EURO|nr:uncharacterized protein N7517_009282 [Penicillium concentricum]KAJ5360091.1 hypothetical protein N7517_009282 [Penicillium concentricum]